MDVSFYSIVAHLRQDRLYLFGTIYVLVFIAVTAVINYFTWTPGMVITATVPQLLFWSLLYLPCFIFIWFSDFSWKEFGFVLNKWVAVFIALTIVGGGWLYLREPQTWLQVRWSASFFEAFARTGEELFFRGFAYVLILRLFKGTAKPHIWAIAISSLLFALPHTQIFLPEHATGSFFQILLFGSFNAFLRHKTDSLLPGITVHVFVQSDLVGVLLSWGIYLLFLLWSYTLHGLTKSKQAIT